MLQMSTKERKRNKNIIKATNKHGKFSLDNFAERGYTILMWVLMEISWENHLSVV